MYNIITLKAAFTYIYLTDATIGFSTFTPIVKEGEEGSVCLTIVPPSGGLECDVVVELTMAHQETGKQLQTGL